MMNTARPSDGSQYLQSVSYTSSVLMWIFIFAKWVNDDSQFLTLVVTVWVFAWNFVSLAGEKF